MLIEAQHPAATLDRPGRSSSADSYSRGEGAQVDASVVINCEQTMAFALPTMVVTVRAVPPRPPSSGRKQI